MTWVYIQTEPSLWTVGHYAPDGTFHTDSDHDTKDDAAARVRWLHGGSDTAPPPGVDASYNYGRITRDIFGNPL